MSNLPLRRKIWFGWTLFRLGFGALIILALFAGAVAIIIFEFRTRHFLNALGILAIVFAGAAFFFVRMVIFRYHIRLGMHKELRKRNLCPNCMYDLRSSPLRCPECGQRLPIPNIEV